MKKQVMKLLSVICAFSVLITLFLPSSVLAQDTISSYNDIKFGVISDVHVHTSATGIDTHLVTMLEYYKAEGVSAVLITGDVANSAKDEEYNKFINIWNRVFPDPKTAPERLIVMGNHEFQKAYYKEETVQQAQQRYMNAYGYTSLNFNKVVDGYHFIGISSEGSAVNGKYTAETAGWLRTQLEAATIENPDSPVFIACHQPLPNTTYGSGHGADGTAMVYDVLKDFPQAVYFSGHSHRPTENERSIWQGGFTSVDVTSLQYVTVEPDYNPQDAYSAQGALLVEIDGQSPKLTINRKRINSAVTPESVRDAKAPWVLSLPLSTDTFSYTNSRIEQRIAPSFGVPDEITVTDFTESSVSFTFPSAAHDDYVQGYNIYAINDATGVTEVSDYYVSDFYLDYTNMAAMQTYTINGLSPGTSYTIKAVAVESFGLESTPLSHQISTKELYNEPSAYNRADFIDLNFTGGFDDHSPYRRTGVPYGSNNQTVLVDSALLSRNVAAVNGHINYPTTNGSLSALTDSFTMELAFMVPGQIPVSQTIAGNIQSTGGIVMRFDSSGKLKTEAYINNYWRSISVSVQPDTWYHAVMTYNGLVLSLYLNGVLVSSVNIAGTVSFDPELSWFCVGGDVSTSGSASALFTGQVAVTRVYTKAMTVGEAADSYHYFVLDNQYEAIYQNLIKLNRLSLVKEVVGLSEIITSGEIILDNAAASEVELNSYIASSNAFLAAVDPWLYEKPVLIGADTEYIETYSYTSGGVEHPTLYNQTDIATITQNNINASYDITESKYYYFAQRSDGNTPGYIEYHFNEKYATSLSMNIILFDQFVTNYSADYIAQMQALCEGSTEYVPISTKIQSREVIGQTTRSIAKIVNSQSFPAKTIAVRIILVPYANEGFKAGGVGYTVRMDDVNFNLVPSNVFVDAMDNISNMQSAQNVKTYTDTLNGVSYGVASKADSAAPAVISYTVNGRYITAFETEIFIMDAFFSKPEQVLGVSVTIDGSATAVPLILQYKKNKLMVENGAYSIYSYTVTCKTSLPLKTTAIHFTLDPQNTGFINYTAFMNTVKLSIDEIPILYGDVNTDGVVDVKDLTRLKKYLADINVYINLKAVDYNLDGIINAMSVTYLCKDLLK